MLSVSTGKKYSRWQNKDVQVSAEAPPNIDSLTKGHVPTPVSKDPFVYLLKEIAFCRHMGFSSVLKLRCSLFPPKPHCLPQPAAFTSANSPGGANGRSPPAGTPT